MPKNYYPRFGKPYKSDNAFFIEVPCWTCFMVPKTPPCPACLGRGFHLISKKEYEILVEADSKRKTHTPRAQLLLTGNGK